jgi:hypothetical protein
VGRQIDLPRPLREQGRERQQPVELRRLRGELELVEARDQE